MARRGTAFDAPSPVLAPIAPVTVPVWFAGAIPLPYPSTPTLPDVLPEALPIQNYARPPVALGRGQISAMRDAIRQGLHPELEIDLGGTSQPAVSPTPSPAAVPAQVTAASFNPNTGDFAAVSAGAGSHWKRPPGRGEKERKYRAKGIVLKLLQGANAIGEMGDLVDSFYKALPREAKIKYKDTPYLAKSVTPLQKAQAVYDNFDLIDDKEALTNLFTNQIEDALFGTAGQNIRRNQLSVQRERPVGWQAGAYKSRYYNRLAQEQQKRDAQKEKK